MSRKHGLGTDEVWRRRLERFEDTGLPVSRFCELEGVSVASFYNWRRKLPMTPRLPHRPGKTNAFQPVHVTATSQGVSVHLSSGTRIDVHDTDLALIRAVVAEVMQASRERGAAC